MRQRMIEAYDGFYYPQHKTGVFRDWRFYRRNADTSPTVLRQLIETADPGQAARFRSEDEALAFVGRVEARVADYYAEEDRALRIEIEGVETKRVINRK